MPGANFKIAVVSDIHGNTWALKAVLTDIKKRGIDKILNLGDSLYGPLAPAETADLLIRHDILSVSGNEDRIIIEKDGKSGYSETLQYVRNSLGYEHRRWLKSLPFSTTVYSDIFLCHGTPGRDDEYFFWIIFKDGKIKKAESELLDLVQAVEEPLILYGHDHTPNMVTISQSKLAVNPGSVGLQAYTDDTPYFHFMETGKPHARYSIISRENSGWVVEFFSVEYDWDTAAKTAKKITGPTGRSGSEPAG
ncbi:MAG: metallophosphoesterase family protein [candidate division Zixibacteria bacterium]|nr:metallophosphoesterase family protein [candidate division Zixibacteria bacterium]